MVSQSVSLTLRARLITSVQLKEAEPKREPTSGLEPPLRLRSRRIIGHWMNMACLARMHTDRIKVATETPAALPKMFQPLLLVRAV